jgi:radical SAM superfamily enzyme YgiQ (UPF0313 family)
MRPIGLASIGAFLRMHGIPADGYDFSDSGSSPEALADHFSLHKYAVLGISFYNMNALLAYRLAQAVKVRNPYCLIVAGGPHATAADQHIIKNHPEIDVVVRNEGEETFHELVDAAAAFRSFEGIKGITHRTPRKRSRESVDHSATSTLVSALQQDSYIVAVEADRERIADLDKLPAPLFDFISEAGEAPVVFPEDPEPHLNRAGRTRNAVPMVTSRSCPYDCNFCAIIMIGRQWRAASPEKVAQDFLELDARSGGKYEHIYFLDANFFVNARRAVAIAEALQGAKPGTTFSFATRANQVVKGRPYLQRLRDLGLRSVEIGIESGSDAALVRFAKDVTAAQNGEALTILRELGIKLGLDFIMFDAEASVGDLRQNLEFFAGYDLDIHIPWESYFNYMTPYLGTAIRGHYERLLGTTFPIDTLPEPRTLILDPGTRRIFDEFHRLCSTVGDMATAVTTLETVCLEPLSERERARRLMNAVSLRRYYFTTLSNLVSAAERGERVCLEDAIPRFRRDDGSDVSLAEVIGHALHRH